MPLIEWSDNLSVKVPSIDEEHKQLIALINELHRAMKEGHGRDIMADVLAKLIDYTQYHFTTEEKLFAKWGFPETAEHLEEHHSFIRKMNEFKEEFNNGKAGISIQLMNFLANWLRGHILGSDMGYTDFFVEKGIQ